MSVSKPEPGMTKADESATTVLIRRPTKVKTDGRGRTVWAGAVEETELELMSSQQLRVAIDTANSVDSESIRAIVESGEDGVVARDHTTGLYAVISEAELQELMDADDALLTRERNRELVPEHMESDTGEELSLVSTQALKHMLSHDDYDDTLDVLDDKPGFDPYDKE
jgi:hypothetical protein